MDCFITKIEKQDDSISQKTLYYNTFYYKHHRLSPKHNLKFTKLTRQTDHPSRWVRSYPCSW